MSSILSTTEQHKKGLWLCHLACFTLGFTALFAKAIPWSMTNIIFFRSFIAGITLIIFLGLTKKLPSIPKKEILFHGLLGLLLAGHWVTYFYSIYVTTVAIGLISLFTFPIFTALLEPYFERSRPKLKDIVISFCLIPGFMIMNHSPGATSQYTYGIGIGILSAIIYSFRNILSKRLSQRYSGTSLMMIQTLIASTILLPFTSLSTISYTPKNILLIVMLGIIFTAIGHTLFISSFKYISAKSASIIASAQPLYGTIWALFFLHEIPTIQTLLGGSIILILVFIETYNHY